MQGGATNMPQQIPFGGNNNPFSPAAFASAQLGSLPNGRNDQISLSNYMADGGEVEPQHFQNVLRQRDALAKQSRGIAGLAQGGYPRKTGQIDGPGTATSDSIPAMLSDGEFVMTAKAVRGAGKGDRRAGAKGIYALMHQLEKNAARG
jgi:hypothetical protein